MSEPAAAPRTARPLDKVILRGLHDDISDAWDRGMKAFRANESQWTLEQRRHILRALTGVLSAVDLVRRTLDR